jgi:hypothetical protein
MVESVNEKEQLLGADLGGVWGTWAAHAAGLSEDDIDGRIGRGEWQRLRRGTYANGGCKPDALMRASSAVQNACTKRRVAVAAGRTAARIYGIPLVDDHDPATKRFEWRHDDVALTYGETTAKTLHSRHLDLGADDVCLVGGIPALTLKRTVVDLGDVLRPDALGCALDHVLHNEWLSRADLEELVTAECRWSGIGAFRRALSLADELAESPHETLTRLLLKPVLPGLRSQVKVFGGGMELIARLDLGDEELRLGVESDGATYHSGRAAEDRRRDYRTGWTIERASWVDTRCRQAELRARVLATAAGLRKSA